MGPDARCEVDGLAPDDEAARVLSRLDRMSQTHVRPAAHCPRSWLGVFVGVPIILTPLLSGEAAPGEVVAVTDLQTLDVSDFSPIQRQKFTSFMDSVVAAAGLRTVPRSEIAAQLAQQQADSYRDCYDEACQIELGKAVAAQKALTSTWTRLGSGCVLAIRLYDLRSSVAEFSTKADALCEEEGLRAAIETVGRALKARRQGGYKGFSMDLLDGQAVKNPPSDESGYLRIRAEAKGEPGLGIEVYINGVLEGTIASGFFTKELPLGRYIVLLRTAGDMFAHQRFDIEMSSSNVQIPKEGIVQLLPTFGLLEIEGMPESATLVINGEPLRIRGRYSAAYRIGTYSIMVEAPGYLPFAAQEISVRPGETSRLEYRLNRNAGSLTINGAPIGAEVLIDEQVSGTLPLALADVNVGEHVIELRARGYHPRRQVVSIRRAEESTVTLELEPKRARLKVEAVTRVLGESQPVEAELLIDGNVVGTTPWKGEVVAEIEHRLTLRLGKESTGQSKVVLDEGAESRQVLEVPGPWAGASASLEFQLEPGPWELRSGVAPLAQSGPNPLRPGRIPLSFLLDGEVVGDLVVVLSPREHRVLQILERPRTAAELESRRDAWLWRRWIATGAAVVAAALGAQQMWVAHRAESSRDAAVALLPNAVTAMELDELRDQVVDKENSRALSQALGSSLLVGAGALSVWAVVEWIFGEPSPGVFRVEGLQSEDAKP